MSARLIGMMLAGVLVGVVGALIAVAYLTAPPALQPTITPGNTTTVSPTPETTPQITDAGTPDTGPANPGVTEEPIVDNLTSTPLDTIGSGEGWRYRAVDENNTLQASLTADRFNPEGRGLYTLDRIRASFFREGRVIRLLAQRGEIRGQRGEEPESGTLTGDVSLALYAPGVTEEQAIAGENGEGGSQPQIVFTTQNLRFDTTLGQATAPDDVAVRAPGVRLDGRGLTIRFGATTSEEDTRLLLVRLEESDGLQLWPDRLPQSASDGSTESRDGSSAGPDELTPTVAEVPIVYRFALSDRVHISRGSAYASAPSLEVFARVFGDGLREGAIAPLRFGRSDVEPSPGATGGPTEVVVEEPRDDPFSETPIIVTWNGPLEFQPLLNVPGVLDFDDAVVRFEGDEPGSVRLADDLAGVGMTGRRVTYFATSAAFEARSGEPDGITLGANGVADLVCGSMDVDLANTPAVRIDIPTPGNATDADGRRLEWDGTAALGATLLDNAFLPASAAVTGGVRLDDGAGGGALCDALDIAFDDRGRPRSIDAIGSVEATQAEQGRAVSADRALLSFSTSGNEPALREVSLSGNAVAQEGARRIEGDGISAVFGGLDSESPTDLSSVLASGNVGVELENGMRVTCDTLRSDRKAGTIDLVGLDELPVRIEAPGDGMTLNARVGSARIEEARERIIGFGAGDGAFESTVAGARYASATLDWGGGFVFDDAEGLLELIGGVDIEAIVDESETHTAEADRAEIVFVENNGVQEINTVHLYAGPGEGGDERSARAEARRTAPDPDSDTGRQLESLLEVRSGELVVHADEQRVAAPGAGRLVVEDRRPEDNADNEPSRRGTTVFRWAGGMDLSLDDGVANLRRDVRVRHLPLDTDAVTTLDCQRLKCEFVRSGADNAFGVRRLDALDSVYAGHMGLELLADALEYIAGTEQIRAMASDGNRVTIFDPERSGHYTASEVVIDLVTGNWTGERTTGTGGAP